VIKPVNKAATASQQKAVIEVKLEQTPKAVAEYFTPYLPVIITILGWWIVSRQNDRRERRKEVRELVRQAEQRVDSVLGHAMEFYSLPGKDPKCAELAAKIRYNLGTLDPLRQRLDANGLKCEAISEIIAFKQSITAEEFESQARKKLAQNSHLLVDAAATGFALIDKLERAYLQAFPVKVRSWF
jgi:hypothetical protein